MDKENQKDYRNTIKVEQKTERLTNNNIKYH